MIRNRAVISQAGSCYGGRSPQIPEGRNRRAAGAATLGFPMISRGKLARCLALSGTWPTKDIFHEYALDYAKKVNDMTGGDLKISAASRRRGQGV
jgi:TRAP-type mannitol/chloroaromatic compound transport system substrate-binding protein